MVGSAPRSSLAGIYLLILVHESLGKPRLRSLKVGDGGNLHTSMQRHPSSTRLSYYTAARFRFRNVESASIPRSPLAPRVGPQATQPSLLYTGAGTAFQGACGPTEGDIGSGERRVKTLVQTRCFEPSPSYIYTAGKSEG